MEIRRRPGVLAELLAVTQRICHSQFNSRKSRPAIDVKANF
jgi:hypothetical protein